MDESEKQRIEQRLEQLREEKANGEAMRNSLEQRLADLNDTMMRIDGAIQVLEELLSEEGPDGGDG